MTKYKNNKIVIGDCYFKQSLFSYKFFWKVLTKANQRSTIKVEKFH